MAEFIAEIPRITPAVEAMGIAASRRRAWRHDHQAQAAKAGRSGIPTIIASGFHPGIVAAVMTGASVGTLFHAESRLWRGREALDRHHPPSPRNSPVDDGAKLPLWPGRSLLPSGIRNVEGEFEFGDLVCCCDPWQ
jgi:glutamate 5-kinase